MFTYCYSFDGKGLPSWDVSGSSSFYSFGGNAYSLNQDLSGWEPWGERNSYHATMNDNSINYFFSGGYGTDTGTAVYNPTGANFTDKGGGGGIDIYNANRILQGWAENSAAAGWIDDSKPFRSTDVLGSWNTQGSYGSNKIRLTDWTAADFSDWFVNEHPSKVPALGATGYDHFKNPPASLTGWTFANTSVNEANTPSLPHRMSLHNECIVLGPDITAANYTGSTFTEITTGGDIVPYPSTHYAAQPWANTEVSYVENLSDKNLLFVFGGDHATTSGRWDFRIVDELGNEVQGWTNARGMPSSGPVPPGGRVQMRIAAATGSPAAVANTSGSHSGGSWSMTFSDINDNTSLTNGGAYQTGGQRPAYIGASVSFVLWNAEYAALADCPNQERINGNIGSRGHYPSGWPTSFGGATCTLLDGEVWNQNPR